LKNSKGDYPAIEGTEPWRLPKPEEFAMIGAREQAIFNKYYREYMPKKFTFVGDGTWAELPGNGFGFWTGSKAYLNTAWLFVRGQLVQAFTDPGAASQSVRCVSRPK
jgi:hypothetical protein